jgi:ABC-type multidrug transport system ATPase subunit
MLGEMRRVHERAFSWLLASWVADGRTIIVIPHDMDVVAEFIPRSVVMAHGEILADGPTEHVLRRPDLLPEARLLAPPAITVSDELSRFGLGRHRTIRGVADDLVRILGGHDAGRV